ncbi:hypothetical protein XENORESO_016822 [Xenotaenia resolanae]|uniref:Uncharacterized protein n=1 Tax=Xenotaenia resolanae TaxID=208358 RepID=A0ABV0VT57_9TELE
MRDQTPVLSRGKRCCVCGSDGAEGILIIAGREDFLSSLHSHAINTSSCYPSPSRSFSPFLVAVDVCPHQPAIFGAVFFFSGLYDRNERLDFSCLFVALIR